MTAKYKWMGMLHALVLMVVLSVNGCSRSSMLLNSDGDALKVEKEGGKLGVGSVAPPLNIEHWLSDGNGQYAPVTQFEPGKVYVVEFWATWCPPCRASMPHLSQLQQRHASEVQVIGVSTEELGKVKQFLTTRPEAGGLTFGEITSGYCLTVDTDGSVQRDYMAASGSTSLPTAFIVGKDSRIHWKGHPKELDGPLQAALAQTL